MSTAQVIKTKILHIKTDKGLLNFPITYIDAPIIEGDYISVNKNTTGGYWYPYTDVCSVLAVKSTPFRACAFTSKNGNLVGSIKSSSDNVYEFTIKFIDNGKENSSTTSYSLGGSDIVLIPSFALFMGNNNVAAFLSGRSIIFIKLRVSSLNASTNTALSNYGFGEFTRKSFDGLTSGTIDKAALVIAKSKLSESVYSPPDPSNNGGNTNTGGGGGTFGGGSTILAVLLILLIYLHYLQLAQVVPDLLHFLIRRLHSSITLLTICGATYFRWTHSKKFSQTLWTVFSDFPLCR